MLVELKNGETLNGHLVTCDNWMNLILREVVQTSPEGDKFFRLPEVYIRGNNYRSNISESPKKSSKLSRSSSKINHRIAVAADETAGVTEAAAVVVVVVVAAGDAAVVDCEQAILLQWLARCETRDTLEETERLPDMSRQALIVDELWYSLCPSFSPVVLHRCAPLLKPRARSSRQHLARPIAIAATLPRQFYSSQAGKSHDDLKTGDSSKSIGSRDQSVPALESLPTSPKKRHSRKEDGVSSEGTPKPTKRLPTNATPDYLQGRTKSWLEEKLQSRMASNPTVRGAAELLRALIRDHQVKPAARHYKALILAQSDHERGSVDTVRSLLEEMEDNGITADSGTLHAVLQVLAVHPDYMLRQEILHTLRDRWLTVSPTGWHFVVAGLIREHQFELAFEQIAMMERKDIPIENWLHSMLIYNLCDFEEFDEVYRLMRTRFEQGYDMSRQLWSHVLTQASDAVHYDTTHFVWRRMVELGYLHPTIPVCRSALQTFSDAADVDMTLAVIRFCTESGFTLGSKDYEKLLKAHLKNGDLYSALGDLCTMQEAAIYIKYGVTLPIFTFMVRQNKDPREAWQMLKELSNQKRKIPVAAVRVIFEVCEHVAKNDSTVADDALGFYKELYTLCPAGPDVRIFNSLLRTCRSAGNREAGMFLVKEMAALKVLPNATTFEIIIFMCLDAGNYKSAYWYFQDLLKRENNISQVAQQEILRLSSKSVNEFAMQLHYHPVVQVRLPGPKREAYKKKQKTRFGSELKVSGGRSIRAPIHRRSKPKTERNTISKLMWTRRLQRESTKGRRALAIPARRTARWKTLQRNVALRKTVRWNEPRSKRRMTVQKPTSEEEATTKPEKTTGRRRHIRRGPGPGPIPGPISS
ncbi:Ribonucleoprotein LSM domain eukaryotic/archaea-type [Penicillium hispanicum]|uniref:Ribonucleoprotein LSM domain eukaryotic/archaea-type n=1 Tax=Penicillium hispanicum TaxID=1080232 RepID=UPI0025425677|nr:Ribonucleoprotein LSM domain eukaryotic/archaea-type [Penicillium hispanicum]KAJ5569543.1 Ribonucleoprotein LSM domain eukaryotic/archaea-type [Penicillium hispanicum]